MISSFRIFNVIIVNIAKAARQGEIDGVNIEGGADPFPTGKRHYFNRHPGLDPGSTWIPDQVRDDDAGEGRCRPVADVLPPSRLREGLGVGRNGAVCPPRCG